VAIWDQAGSHPRPARIHLLPLPAYSPDLNPVEVIGDVIKDRIASTPWHTLESLEEALGEELRPVHETAERGRRLASHPRLANWQTLPQRRILQSRARTGMSA